MPPFPLDSTASAALDAPRAAEPSVRAAVSPLRLSRSDARAQGAQGTTVRGDVAFVTDDELPRRTAELRDAGVVIVRVPPLPSVLQGHLAEHVDERVERELSARGAPSPCLSAWGSMPDEIHERLADQLFRARSVGATGLALVLGTLAAAGTTLDPDDSATLRRLTRLSAEAPVFVLLEDGDRTLGGFAAPIPLDALLAGVGRPLAAPAVTPIAAEARHASPAAMDEATATEPAAIEPAAEGATDDPHAAHAIDAARAPHHDASMPHPSRAATAGVTASGPSDFWRGWALSLGAARGPQPLANLERLFAECYVPLANAIAFGLDDPRAFRAYDEFRRSFERTYTDAFATFGATGRRPRLVMDAYDFAAKQARAHEARSGQVLVVDSLRYDLGERVRDALAARAGGFATLASETLLWSALPTTTFRQLETLARGADALRDPMIEEPAESLRGRVAENVRRLRVGSRELYKLDVVPAMLANVVDQGARGGSSHVVAAFEDVAESVADAVARHFAAAPPRTLVVVTGDHGFCIDRRGNVTSGGASPEEVLVPAFAYLTSDVH